VPTAHQIVCKHSLAQQVLCSMVDVIIGKGGHEVVAVIVVGLHSQVDTLVVARLFSGLGQVFGQELALLVEVVASTLKECISVLFLVSVIILTRTTSMSISRGPFHFLMSSVASCSAHFSFLSSPK